MTTPKSAEASYDALVFEVPNYSLHRGDLALGSFLRLPTFDVGGCAWSLRIYPSGQKTPGYLSVALELMTRGAVVLVSYDMWLLDDATGARYSAVESGKAEFDTRSVEGFLQAFCLDKFIKSSDLEASSFLRGDRLMIECALRVIKATILADVGGEPRAVTELAVPQSELPEHMGRLLDGGDGADVTFVVQAESFRAHRNVVAVRTPPTFRAMLEVPTKDDGSTCLVRIDDMKAVVFDAVLRFIYTDQLRLRQALDELGNDGRVEMANGLLAAADMFDMGRFKILCEQMILKSIEVDTVAATLVLADRYNCSGLRDACIEFMISGRMDDVARTEGYAVLKADHPYLLVEAFEKAGKLGKI